MLELLYNEKLNYNLHKKKLPLLKIISNHVTSLIEVIEILYALQPIAVVGVPKAN